jgi:hypothetical protein
VLIPRQTIWSRKGQAKDEFGRGWGFIQVRESYFYTMIEKSMSNYNMSVIRGGLYSIITSINDKSSYGVL